MRDGGGQGPAGRVQRPVLGRAQWLTEASRGLDPVREVRREPGQQVAVALDGRHRVRHRLPAGLGQDVDRRVEGGAARQASPRQGDVADQAADAGHLLDDGREGLRVDLGPRAEVSQDRRCGADESALATDDRTTSTPHGPPGEPVRRRPTRPPGRSDPSATPRTPGPRACAATAPRGPPASGPTGPRPRPPGRSTTPTAARRRCPGRHWSSRPRRPHAPSSARCRPLGALHPRRRRPRRAMPTARPGRPAATGRTPTPGSQPEAAPTGPARRRPRPAATPPTTTAPSTTAASGTGSTAPEPRASCWPRAV